MVIIGLVVAATFYASFLPNKSATDVSGYINPSEDLTFSGAAVVFQQQTSALKQTAELSTFQNPTGNQTQSPNTDLLRGLTLGEEQDSISLEGLLSPLQSPIGVTSSSAAEQNSSSESTREDGRDGDDEDDGETPDEEELKRDNCDTSVSSIYCVYTIQEGELLSTIADRFGLTSTDDFVNYELLVHSNNSVVVDPDAVSPGLQLIIPRGNGVIHTVLTNQTLTEIAEQYGVDVEAIMAVPGNGISNPNAVGIGSEILIPNPQRFAPVYVPDESVVEDGDDDEDDVPSSNVSEDDDYDDSSDSSASSSSDSSADSSSSSGQITGGGASSASGFSWPISGPISSYYGPSHPLGIDIDLFGRSGEAISAAMGGVVTFAGGNACCSYGYYVVIDHGNGYQTLYAHLSSIGVSVGETVAQGQYIGGAGTTGYSTGVHLHFELQSGGSRVNPLNYLP